MLERLKRLVRRSNDEDGQGLTEYALLIVLTGLICVAAVSATGQNINGLIQNVAASLSTVS